ncbi:Signal transducer regulating beta-lactamase production, contains metallopeptidase domain [Maribacter sedimenticola]|uniref:Signal transducer regulating beta-lactamase production, contains metallopeptidase domain n=1 Tax=Maribacter sedimenticola TaxID=228956 RepID=A0ABY1SF67_9FLAO|nr:M56 family metallopeptidase [Maribacter sedimenticola]SNR31531.1 Signal transducer regulating beta-lactamase production, contains metallopeptidase domain [Maribacter sedimenticola]
MEAICFYILKSGVLLFLFYGSYYILLKNETLFRFNRHFLLSGLIISVVLPSFYITKNVTVPLYTIQQETTGITALITSPLEGFWNTSLILMILYTTGALFFLARLFAQLIQLRKILKDGQIVYAQNTIHLRTNKNVLPFSFFRTIVYNPSKHNPKELAAIVAHEEVHAKQYHSIDILIMELIMALQWFNPFVWLYRMALKQNLEYLADTENSQIKFNKKAYQYILLQQACSNYRLSIVNPFFNSLIKKRIVMINQKQSHQLNALKSLIMVPLIAFFLISFNTKEVYAISDSKVLTKPLNTIEVLIDKHTTDDELLKIKKELQKEKFDFSYTVVRNEEGFIKSISLQVTGGNKKNGEASSSFNSVADNDTIDPTYISIDLSTNRITIRNGKAEHKMIQVRTSPSKKLKITSKSDSDHDIEIMEEEGNTFLYIENDKQPLIYIDGKKSDHDILKSINPSNIATMNVIKGEAAITKYGKSAQNGVIEITTKN